MRLRSLLPIGLLAAFMGGCAVLPVRAAIAEDARPGPCRAESFTGVPYIVCEASPDQLVLRLTDDRGRTLGNFRRLFAALPAEPLFAMNAGMYHQDRAPVGLYVEDGETLSPLVTGKGAGNFFLLPNGVFWIDGDGAHVTPTDTYAAADPAPRLATQSGPILVMDGVRHPRFIPGGTSVHIRNGVGVRPDGTVVFAISRAPVNFYDFAGAFLSLGAPNALYFDGSVSALAAPHLGVMDRTETLGPLIAALPKGDTP